MEWLTCIRKALAFIEDNLHEDISVQDVANVVYISSVFLQKGFSVMTGYGINEYIRNRRLYQAAVDLSNTDKKIIDIALDYAYETPESFTKAFTRFHGATPKEIRMKEAPIKTFLPLQINISITGGEHMEYRIVKMSSFKVVGYGKSFTFDEAQKEIPKFWTDVYNLTKGNTAVGEFGICIDDVKTRCLHYMIAGKYIEGAFLDGMEVYEIPSGEWAVFDCYGPMPNAIQEVTNKIFNEWLPGNPDFEINGTISIEWYDHADTQQADYHSQVWLPIKRK